jgi:hypothetical protein
MSETAVQQTAEGSPGPRTGHGGCKPHLVHCQRCTTEGIAKQAEYNAKTQPDIDQAHVTYTTTRKDYRARRSEVTLQVQDMRHQIKHLVDRIRCLIQQEQVVECLDRAWCEIAKKLDKCWAPAPELMCDFDISGDEWECDPDADEVTHLDDADYTALVAKITKYQDQVDKAKARFADLAGEPAALVKRVADAKAEIDAINAALTADPATTDLKRVYAQALVARRHIRLIWNGFEQGKDFIEALCAALNCWSTGNRAVSQLTGKRAFEDCMRAARMAQCTELQTNTVDEILTWYEKYCPPPDCDDSKPVDPDCPEEYGDGKPPDGYGGEPGPGYPPDQDQGYDRDRPPDYQGDRPRDYDNDRPRDYQGDRPPDYQGDRPRDYDNDRPRDYQGDRPPDYQGDRPRDYDNDRPRDYQGDRPRDYPDDRPRDDQGDRGYGRRGE